eukprot:gene11389-13948_t
MTVIRPNKKQKKDNNTNGSKLNLVLLFIVFSSLTALVLSGRINIDHQLELVSNFFNFLHGTEITVLASFDYSKLTVDETISSPPKDWIYFQFGDYVANQGKISVELDKKNKESFLRVNSDPFTLTSNQSDIDHVKWLGLSKETYKIPEKGELVCSFNMRGYLKGVDKHPFGNLVLDADRDWRLGFVAANSLDFKTMIVADFFLTNTGIYALYERLPFARPFAGNYASFTHVIPVGHRTPDQFHQLSVVWNKAEKTIKYLIGEKVVFTVNRVGRFLGKDFRAIDRGGVEEDIFPNEVQCGGGSFTLLDAVSPCYDLVGTAKDVCSTALNTSGLVQLNPDKTGYFNPRNNQEHVKFFDDKSLDSNRVFGSGGIMDLKSMKVFTTSRKN